MIKIFYCNSLNENIPEEISEYRKNKILSSTKNRQAMINTARALRTGFAHFGINEQNVIYEITENGKPFAKNYPLVHFSISHSDNFSIIAFHEKEIGIDCEISTKEISNDTIIRFFTNNEFSSYKNNYRLLWVAKEATVKYSGKGLALGRSEYEIPYFVDEISFGDIWLKRLRIEGYDCALCTSDSDEIEIHRINE